MTPVETAPVEELVDDEPVRLWRPSDSLGDEYDLWTPSAVEPAMPAVAQPEPEPEPEPTQISAEPVFEPETFTISEPEPMPVAAEPEPVSRSPNRSQSLSLSPHLLRSRRNPLSTMSHCPRHRSLLMSPSQWLSLQQKNRFSIRLM